MGKNAESSKEEKGVTTGGVAKEPDVIRQEVFYSAPLPPAVEFERYERVLKGAADRIIKLAENQNKHRRFIEKIVVIFDALKSIGGLFSAFLIVLVSMVAGVYLIMNDKSTQGLWAMFVPLGGIIAAFLYEKSKKSKEREVDREESSE